MIRPLQREDLPATVRLYERVARSGTGSPRAGLVEEFERTVLDHPWFDPELPSLVYEDGDGGIVGFLGSHPRRLRFRERELRLACSGQLVAHPDYAGVGALLLRKYLAGPQDLTITDGATGTVRELWQGLGGSVNELASVGWTRVLRPAVFAAGVARRRGLKVGAAAPRLVDSLAARRFAPPPASASSEPLTAAAVVEGLERLRRRFPLQPAYDARFLDWLFREAAAVGARGRLLARLVRGPDRHELGWYVAYAAPGEVAQVLQLAAAPADAGYVIDELLQQAHSLGAVAVQGRIEPHLHPHLRNRRCILHQTEWALLHGGDAETRDAIAYGRALLTRLEGEWWMGHHLI